ncbi:MAG: carbamoyltransferase HypF [Lachnospiraceae bacterium]|nr:carbamoyltransferase HypF [Lachnospiraceae bacterium]
MQSDHKIRQKIRVYGIVQGIGFRPFVVRLARRLGVVGDVCNKGSYVEIHAEAAPATVSAFRRGLIDEAPSVSAIIHMNVENEPAMGDTSFRILQSVHENGDIYVSPDLAICPDCKKEMFDPRNRRYLHPFINCTNCGPRLTILDSMPYDRVRTSMGEFPMCPDCEYEYTHPSTRRFHAQPVCCNDCGPTLTLLRRDQGWESGNLRQTAGSAREGESRKSTSILQKKYTIGNSAEDQDAPDASIHQNRQTAGTAFSQDREATRGAGENRQDRAAIRGAREILRSGGILAVKGIGGFHLACDAANEAAVERLRELKHRPAKPFAVMMRDLATVRRECQLLPGEESILDGVQKPILLLRKSGPSTCSEQIETSNHSRMKGTAEADAATRPGQIETPDYPHLAEAVAPGGNPNVGVMLPYAPVQLLLFGEPDGLPMTDMLVMTSGNPSGAPICRTTEEALRYLAPMCDGILTNDRKIRLRADDSVMQFVDGRPYMIRRSRGYAPLPFVGPGKWTGTALGIGGELKNTFCLAKNELYYPSPYIGDLADLRSVEALKSAINRMETLLEVRPEVVGCDIHPRYNSTAVARQLGIPVVPVQHHFAHVLSCMAENQYFDPVIGISLDGTGYGTDGTIWGGEFLISSPEGFQRFGSLEPFRQAGGDASSKEGWRIAVSLLFRENARRLFGPARPQTPAGGSAHGQAGPQPAFSSEESTRRQAGPQPALTPAEENAIFEETLRQATALGLCDENALRMQFLMLRRNINTVTSTSAGRLFDAVSAILGIRRASTFEGEASMALEFASAPDAPALVPPALIGLPEEKGADERQFLLPTGPLVDALVQGRLVGGPTATLAGGFHTTLAEMICQGAIRCRVLTGLNTVALSGGCFQNLLLLKKSRHLLEEAGFRVLTHSLVPPNDGGICLGQALAAMRTLQ